MNKKKKKVIKLLNELVAIFKERKTVIKILQAKDFKNVYETEKVAMIAQLESFQYEVVQFSGYPVSDASKAISADNVVEICFILLMSGVDDVNLIDDWESIGEILQDVPEDLQEIAQRFSKFLYEEQMCFSECKEEELLEELLL